MALSPIPLGIYIQVPFCQTKCTYCNFHTGVVSRDRFEPYADAICREIVASAPPHGQAVDTVYFGGGTPSLLDPSSLRQFLDTLRRVYKSDSVEATLEADPETIMPDKASAWLAAGFNRISLGAQSFSDLELRSTGRMHRSADIGRAVQVAREAGFRNISMDLIAGLPHQTRETWDASLDGLLRIRPEHVSIYMLEIDEGSRLGREALARGTRYGAGDIPSDDAIADFYESACTRLTADGYEHYEISNWALPGFRSRHNLKYWRREPYIGFGAGAHSFDGNTRWANIHDPARYAALVEQGISTREQIETVAPYQALEEEFFLGLRQLEGIDLARIEREYGAELREQFEALSGRIAGLHSQGLVELEGSRLRLAPTRLAISSEVFVELLG